MSTSMTSIINTPMIFRLKRVPSTPTYTDMNRWCIPTPISPMPTTKVTVTKATAKLGMAVHL